MRRLNHSRYIDAGAKAIANRMYESARATPTAKQIKFYNSLYGKCKDNNVDSTTGHPHSRAGYARAIDTLLARLKEAGIDVYSNGKEACSVLFVGEDKYGNDYVKERLLVKETKQCDDTKQYLGSGHSLNICYQVNESEGKK